MVSAGSIVHLRLPAPLLAEIDRRAGVELRSRSNLCAFLIRQGLAEPDEANEED